MKAGTIISDLDSAQVCGVQNGGTTSGQGPGPTPSVWWTMWMNL